MMSSEPVCDAITCREQDKHVSRVEREFLWMRKTDKRCEFSFEPREGGSGAELEFVMWCNAMVVYGGCCFLSYSWAMKRLKLKPKCAVCEWVTGNTGDMYICLKGWIKMDLERKKERKNKRHTLSKLKKVDMRQGWEREVMCNVMELDGWMKYRLTSMIPLLLCFFVVGFDDDDNGISEPQELSSFLFISLLHKTIIRKRERYSSNSSTLNLLYSF